MKNVSTVAALLISVLLIFGTAMSQPEKGAVGISVLIQNPQLDFVLPVWIADRFVATPLIGFSSISNQWNDYAFGLGVRGYVRKEKLSSYLSVRFAVLIYAPKSGSSATDILFGPAFGAEYYFDEHFSVGEELQLNVAQSDSKSNRFGNPGGTNINTATAVTASFYF